MQKERTNGLEEMVVGERAVAVLLDLVEDVLGNGKGEEGVVIVPGV